MILASITHVDSPAPSAKDCEFTRPQLHSLSLTEARDVSLIHFPPFISANHFPPSSNKLPLLPSQSTIPPTIRSRPANIERWTTDGVPSHVLCRFETRRVLPQEADTSRPALPSSQTHQSKTPVHQPELDTKNPPVPRGHLQNPARLARECRVGICESQPGIYKTSTALSRGPWAAVSRALSAQIRP